jgi:hypothetical protein
MSKRFELPLSGANGVKRWARWHRHNETKPVKIKGDPLRYLHAHARRLISVRNQTSVAH